MRHSSDSAALLRTRIRWLDILVFLGILTVAVARLPTPLGGDQAQNVLIAQVIDEGGAPYREVWDLKHPGLFFFNAAAGALFGFDEIGIHLFELLWMLGLAVLVRVAAGRWLENRTIASLTPALTVGLYYAVAGERYLTQTEAVVGLPLLLSLWCIVQAVRDERRMRVWLAASGLAAGVVTVFKFLLLAIPVAFWLLAIREMKLRRGQGLPRVIADVAPWLLAGVVLPIVATVAFLAERGIIALALWTYFDYPVESLAAVPMEPSRLIRAARSFVENFAPAVAFAIVGIGDALLLRRMDTLAAGLCAWLVVGALLIVIQVISWWDYHFLLLLVPVGLLAARGLEVAGGLITAWLKPVPRGVSRLILMLGLTLLFAQQLGAAIRVSAAMWGSRPLPLSDKGVAAYQAEHQPHYAAIRARTAFLHEPGSHPGPIYVLDTPTYHLLAGRRPAVPFLTPWFYPSDTLWKRVVVGLADARPPYIRVADWALEEIVRLRPSLRGEVASLVASIKASYEPLSRDQDGTWYVRRDLARD